MGVVRRSVPAVVREEIRERPRGALFSTMAGAPETYIKNLGPNRAALTPAPVEVAQQSSGSRTGSVKPLEQSAGAIRGVPRVWIGWHTLVVH
jgi:hypothetical protein